MIIVIIVIILICIWYILVNRRDDFMELDPVIVDLKNRLISTFPELNNVKLMKGTSSYTINKYKIYICTEHNGTKYDTNMLTYVIIHELAHVLTTEVGHGSDFVKQFNKLLDRAYLAGVYDPTQPRVENYCKT